MKRLFIVFAVLLASYGAWRTMPCAGRTHNGTGLEGLYQYTCDQWNWLLVENTLEPRGLHVHA